MRKKHVYQLQWDEINNETFSFTSITFIYGNKEGLKLLKN